MSEWVDDFVKIYKTYKDTMKCLSKDNPNEQMICILKLNATKKKKKRKKRKSKKGY